MKNDQKVETKVVVFYKSKGKIQPKSVKGVFATWRWLFVALT